MRFITGLCAVATIAVLTVGTSATTSADPLTPSTAVDNSRAATATVHDTLDEALGAAGIDQGTFATQSDVAAQLADDSANWALQFPHAFAGVRMSGVIGEVGVVPDAPAADELRAAAHDRGYRTFGAPRSARDLDDQAQQIENWKDSLSSHDRDSVAGTQVDPERGEVTILVTEPGNQVDPQQAGADRVNRSRFRQAQGSLSNLGSSGNGNPSTPIAPRGPGFVDVNDPPPSDALLGGSRFLSQDNSSEVANWCSLGFHGQLGNRVVSVTAAHCATYGFGNEFRPSTMREEIDGPALGQFTTELTDVDLDAAVVEINDSSAPRFHHYRVHGADNDTPVDISAVHTPIPGQTVCKYGQRSGYTCGEVHSIDASTSYEGTDVTIDLCALSGDSGGVVFAGTRAVGIVSLSNAFTTGGRPYASCSEATDELSGTSEKPQIIAISLDAILDRFPGLQIYTK